jgi:predicted DNA-binding mobile mystery protein A
MKWQVIDCMKKDMTQIIRQGLDEGLPVLRNAHMAAKKPARGWLRAVRDAANLSQDKVANKLGTKRQSYAQMETAEERGSITVNSLRRAAESMDCELVYFLVPRESVAETYDELARINDPLHKHLEATEHSMALEGQAVGDLKPRRKPSG